MFKRILAVAVVAAIALSAGAFAQESASHNTLTAKEKAAGWKLLFDGKTTNGWHCFGNKPVNGWTVENGELVALGKEGLDIITDGEYENFELTIEWKLSKLANSGIFYDVVEEGFKAPYESGPEYQLLDDINWPDKIEGWQTTGANYAMYPPKVKAMRPIGEWNQTKIIVNKSHVEQWLNGKMTVSFERWTPDWEARIKAGKWKDYPGYAKAKKGKIGMQHEQNKVFFRNIKIREL